MTIAALFQQRFLVFLLRAFFPAHVEVKNTLPGGTACTHEVQSDMQAGLIGPAAQSSGNDAVMAERMPEDSMQFTLRSAVQGFFANLRAETIEGGNSFGTDEDKDFLAAALSSFGHFRPGGLDGACA